MVAELGLCRASDKQTVCRRRRNKTKAKEIIKKEEKKKKKQAKTMATATLRLLYILTEKIGLHLDGRRGEQVSERQSE